MYGVKDDNIPWCLEIGVALIFRRKVVQSPLHRSHLSDEPNFSTWVVRARASLTRNCISGTTECQPPRDFFLFCCVLPYDPRRGEVVTIGIVGGFAGVDFEVSSKGVLRLTTLFRLT